jgi:hypoxanthine phosphoribosyltransferase
MQALEEEPSGDLSIGVQNKRYIDANDLLVDSFALAVKVYESGFRPDFLVGLWRGGTAVGIAVQEGLEFLGVPTDHIAVRTSYAGPAEYSRRPRKIQVHGLRYVLERVTAEHSLLIVDDVYSSGRSVQAVVDKLARKARRNTPHDIRTAAVWMRPSPEGKGPPDYFVRETEDWLVLPYELSGLTLSELAAHKPAMAGVLEELKEIRAARVGG